MDLFGEIENLSYRKIISKDLQRFEADKEKLDINSLPTTCIIEFEGSLLALGKWVSPKRTRSYPYSRVYDTLQREVSKTVTVIPVVKDEGKAGDRDYLQWDTVSLMSLLNVYVIPAYYCDAVKNKKGNKITRQRFANDYVSTKLDELVNYRASALHWNLKQLSKDNLDTLIAKVIDCYRFISRKTQVELHSELGLLNFKEKILEGIEEFKKFSRDKAQGAQSREVVTNQPKELTGNGIKAKLTIKNYLGGFYFFTVDEVTIVNDTIYLIEAKHSRDGVLPSEGDIKDGLLKMILYTNIERLHIEGKRYNFVPVLKLTSGKLRGRFINNEIMNLGFKGRRKSFIEKLINESRVNGFEVWLEGKYG